MDFSQAARSMAHSPPFGLSFYTALCRFNPILWSLVCSSNTGAPELGLSLSRDPSNTSAVVQRLTLPHGGSSTPATL